MATCTYNPNINSYNPTVTLEVTQITNNIENNTSTVTYSLKLYRPSFISSGGPRAYTITINGQKVKDATVDGIGGEGTKTIASGTVTVPHNSDGTKTLSFSFTFTFNITWSGTYMGTGSASGSMTLPTIPRTSNISVSATSVNFGSDITVNTNRASTSFTHKLYYSLNGGGNTLIASDITEKHTWTVPNTLMNSIPNATSATIALKLYTYSSTGTSLGSSSKSITVNVPTSIKPSITLDVSEYVTNVYTIFKAYLKDVSRLNLKASGSGTYSSTIKSYKITANGQTFTTATAVTNVLTKSGSMDIVATVTDSRGRVGSITKTIKVDYYSFPKITEFNAYRSDLDGTPNDQGSTVTLVLKGGVANLTNNTANYKIAYKKTNDTSYTYKTINSDTLSIDQTYKLLSLSTDSSYNIIFTITDALGKVSTSSVNLSTAFTLMNFNEQGNGIGFGKLSEIEKVVDFGIKAKFRNGENSEGAIVIQPNTDINTIIEPGYYVFSSATSTTLTNLPFTNASSGSITVIREGESTQVRQIITRCSVNREIWERLYYSNTWQSTQCIYKGGNRVLWSGSSLMSGSDTITLSQKIDSQVNGIVLVFSRYSSSTTRDYHFNSFFVSRNFIELMPGVGNTFIMSTDGSFSVMATKYLYIHNDKITGNDINTTSGTGTSNVKYENNGFVLRYVIGV